MEHERDLLDEIAQHVRIIGDLDDVERNSRLHWNARYAAGGGPRKTTPHPWLVHHLWRLRPGRALDIACGMGRDSIFLARRGFRVHGIDFSAVALSEAQRRARAADVSHRVSFILADLTAFAFPREHYDLVICFSYWEPKLKATLREAVKPGGFIIYETFNVWWKWTRPEVEERFLLQPGELLDWLKDWRVWAYREVGSDLPLTRGHKAVSSIVAQKPRSG